MIDTWKEIEHRTDLHGYMSGIDRESTRVKKTGEVYTPTVLVTQMMQQILKSNSEAFAPGKTVLDPACGDGQLLVPVKWYKVLHHGMSEEDALKDIYGVDIMRDNVDLCKKRLGGGTILMGNTLDVFTRLDEQTEAEHNMVIELFAPSANLMSFFE